MSNSARAERRRQLREAGYRRAPGKKGRRSALRAKAPEPKVSELVLPTPELTGRIVRGEIKIPTLEDLMNRGDG
jgi:hypothetical protein